jgi:hypothetical protein
MATGARSLTRGHPFSRAPSSLARVAVTIEDVQAARIPPIELGALDGDVSRGVELDGRSSHDG